MAKHNLKIDQIVEEYINLLEKDKAPPIKEFIKQYPELESDLRARLEAVQLMIESKKEMTEISEELKQRLHSLFWKNLREKEKARLLAVQKEMDKKDALPVERGIEYLLLLLHIQSRPDKALRFNRTVEEKTEPFLTALRGITRIMKLLFLLGKEAEFEKRCATYYQFEPYKLGPFTVQVYEDMKLLMELGFVQSQHFDREGLPIIYTDDTKIDEGFRFNDVTAIYYLTDKGNKYAEKLAKSLNPKQIEQIREIKEKFGSLPLKAFLRFIYQRYPEYTTKSEILESLF